MIIVEEYIKQKSREERRVHLKLEEKCIERGGDSRNHRGVLVVFLNSNFPVGKYVHLCHACNNGKCSNPVHLYWGTNSDNIKDAYECGNRKAPNSNGKRWINNGIKRKFIILEKPLSNGWKFGFKL